jgi:hypothetical protein
MEKKLASLSSKSGPAKKKKISPPLDSSDGVDKEYDNAVSETDASKKESEDFIQGMKNISIAPKKVEAKLSPLVKKTPKYTAEQEEKIHKRLDEVNEMIGHFKALGYRTDLKTGFLYKPEPISMKQTGATAKVVFTEKGAGFFLYIQDRQHNELIKGLGGKWNAIRKAWIFSLSRLESVRSCFKIVSETAAVPKVDIPTHDPGVITFSIIGDYISIKGDTKPLKEIFKANGFRWNPTETMWVYKNEEDLSSMREKILNELEALKEEGVINEVIVEENE